MLVSMVEFSSKLYRKISMIILLKILSINFLLINLNERKFFNKISSLLEYYLLTKLNKNSFEFLCSNCCFDNLITSSPKRIPN